MRPKLLDMFCKAGGASMGYHRAGFCVTGVDIEPQKNYPFPFIQADCMELDVDFLRQFDAIHASPPCQAHSDLKHMWNAKKHKDLVEPTRRLLLGAGKPFIIENVEGAPLINPIKLCGTMFALKTKGAELRRHRLFELNWPLLLVPNCNHGQEPRVIGVYGGHGRDRRRTVNTQDFPTSARREAMGIGWMTGAELSQAIPPAYTEWIGKYLYESLKKT
jgi:DNA (cytosine-5)-methyltransferase 1